MREILISSIVILMSCQVMCRAENRLLENSPSSFFEFEKESLFSDTMEFDLVTKGIEYDLFNKSLDALGIKNKNIFLAISDKLYKNARYRKMKSGSYIIYDKSMFLDIPNWEVAFIGIIGHELGHYINHHADVHPQIPESELEADYCAGYLLARLNYDTSEVNYYCNNRLSKKQAPSYPSYEERKTSILNGYSNGVNCVSIDQYSNSNVIVLWEKIPEGKIIIKHYEEEQEFSKSDIHAMKEGVWDTKGVVYIPTINSTIELTDWNKRKRMYGRGKIVNNRTDLTWRRERDNFWIYRKGNAKVTILDTSEKDQYWCKGTEGYCEKDVDYVIRFYDEARQKPVKYILKNYKYAEDGHLTSAFIVENY